MRLPCILLAGLLATATGCSKKEAEATADTSPAASEPSAARPAKPASAEDGAYDPSVAATVPTTTGGTTKAARAEAGVAAKNWDAVVAEIVQLRAVNRTPAQTERLNSLQDEIVGAINSDPAAKEAYQNLARLINRR